MCSCCLVWTQLNILFMSPVFFSSGASCRPHPYRKRPTLSNVSNQYTHQNIQQNFNLRYQDSYGPEYPPLHRVTASLLPPSSVDCFSCLYFNSINICSFTAAHVLSYMTWCGLMPICRFSPGRPGPLVRTAGERWCPRLGRIQSTGVCVGAQLILKF